MYALPFVFCKFCILTVSAYILNLLVFTKTCSFLSVIHFINHLIDLFYHLHCVRTIYTIHATNIPACIVLFTDKFLLPRPSYKFILRHFNIDIMIFFLYNRTLSSPHFYISTELSINFSQINDLFLIIFLIFFLHLAHIPNRIRASINLSISNLAIHIRTT